MLNFRHERMTKFKCPLNGPSSTLEVESVDDFSVNMEPYRASVNSLLSLLSLLLRAVLKTLSHTSSQYEIMVGTPSSLSASS